MTVYAFSLENFNRPPNEVKGLMLLAKTKLAQLVQHGELMERYDARIKVCGKLDLIPEDVMEVMDKAVEATSKNNGFVHQSHFSCKLSLHLDVLANKVVQPCLEPLLSIWV